MTISLLATLKAMLTDLLDGLCRVVMFVIMTLTGVMVASMCAQVFWRYVLNDSLIWPEELSRYAFLWVSCLGMSVGIRRGDLIAIDVLWASKPRGVRLFISLVAHLLTLPLLIAFVWEGWALVDIVTGQRAAAMNVPVWWIYLALPVSAVLGFLFTVEAIAGDFRALFGLKGGGTE
jgi:TRAP-type C4-dicarboxylate transport system permease small subunit